MKITTLMKGIVPVAVLFAGFSAMGYLIKTRPKAEVKQPAESSTLVTLAVATPKTEAVSVEGTGTVVASRTLVVQTEVSGRIVSMNTDLVAGGRLVAGDLLVRIDDRDTKLQISQQKAQVASAKAQLRVEKGRRRVAQREWKLLGNGKGASQEGQALALREPQVAAARASVRSSQAALRRAKLLDSKTEIKVPFNAVVENETVELDQLVGPSSRLATLVGTDQYWVEVSLPVDRLSSIAIPGVNTTESRGSRCGVTLDVGKGPIVERIGYVLRLKPSIDPAGRMARVVVAVDNPLGIRPDGTTDGLPLLKGAFVNIRIEGRKLNNVVVLPRLALREGNAVWVMNSDSRLEVKPVDVRWRLRDQVLVSGLTPGERIITSLVPAMVPNMKLAIDEDNAAESTAKAQRTDDARNVQETNP